MSRKSFALSLAIALGLAMTGAAVIPASAGQNILPGVKGYNFNASPAALRRLCRNSWGGRYWKVGPAYGCDKISRKGQKFRIQCLVPKVHTKEYRCAIRRVRFNWDDGPDNFDHGQGQHHNPGRTHW